MFAQITSNTAKPTTCIPTAAGSARLQLPAAAVDPMHPSVNELSRQRPTHPMRMSQYELSALFCALPSAMLKAFALAYQLPPQAKELACKRMSGAPWTRAQLGRIQFFVKWCLTTTLNYDVLHGQRALHHYLAACIETAYGTQCLPQPPLTHEPLAVAARLGELRQRDIVKLVRGICDAEADIHSVPVNRPEVHQAAAPTCNVHQAQAPSQSLGAPGSGAMLSPVLGVHAQAALRKLEHVLASPGGLSTLTGHLSARATLQDAVSFMRSDFTLWFEAQEAAVQQGQTAHRAQAAALLQLEQQLKETSTDIVGRKRKCDEALQTLEQTRASLDA